MKYYIPLLILISFFSCCINVKKNDIPIMKEDECIKKDLANESNSIYLYRIFLDNRIGFINNKGKIIIKPIYDIYKHYLDDDWYRYEYSYHYYNRELFTIIPCFNYSDPFNQGLAKIKYNGKWGFINNTGKLVVPANYDDVHHFKEGRAAVLSGKKWGYIDLTGNMIIKPQYDEAFYFFNERTCVRKDEKFGFIDKNGKVIIPFEYDLTITNTRSVGFRTYYGFREDMVIIEKNGKKGVMNKHGEFVIPLNDARYSDFEFGCALAIINEKRGIINTKGKYIIEPEYDTLSLFSEKGIAVFRRNRYEKFGLINMKGEIILNPVFDLIASFYNDRAFVCTGEGADRKYGYINSTGQIIIPLIYDSADNFRNGYGIVSIREMDENGKYKGLQYGVIDQNENYIIKPIVKGRIIEYHDGIAINEVGILKFDLVDTAGNRITGNEYDFIGPFIGGIAEVWLQQDGVLKIGYIDKTGKYIWEPTN